MIEELYNELKKRYLMIETLKKVAADGKPADRIEGRMVTVYNEEEPVLEATVTINNDGPECTTFKFSFTDKGCQKGTKPVEDIDDDLHLMAEMIEEYTELWVGSHDGVLTWDWLGD